ncbi:MAG: hypothetical protein ACOX4L_11410 [Bacillota bacterium]
MFKGCYIKALFMVGIVILVGLNTAAQGSHRMAPHLPPEVISWDRDQDVLSFFALGNNFTWDTQGIILQLDRFKIKTQQIFHRINFGDLIHKANMAVEGFRELWLDLWNFLSKKWQDLIYSLLVTSRFLSYN